MAYFNSTSQKLNNAGQGEDHSAIPLRDQQLIRTLQTERLYAKYTTLSSVRPVYLLRERDIAQWMTRSSVVVC